jgi:peptide/nickel transport system substrate-binding protein
MIFNARKPALHDSAVRRAIAYAIDKKSIIAKISHNVGEISYNTYPRTALGYERLAPYGYDPERAQALLQKDGWVPGADGIRVRNGERLSFTLASITGAATLERMALDMQSELRTVGIDMSIKAYPYNTIFAIDGPIYRGIYDAAIYSQTLNWDPNVLDYVGCNLWYPKGENTFGYCNHDLDALEAAGLQTDDTARRIAIYRKAGRIIWHDLPYLPLYQYRRLIVHNNDLKNYSVNPTSTPWWNAYKWDIWARAGPHQCLPPRTHRVIVPLLDVSMVLTVEWIPRAATGSIPVGATNLSPRFTNESRAFFFLADMRRLLHENFCRRFHCGHISLHWGSFRHVLRLRYDRRDKKR